jgi:hypothetical protein
LSTFNKKSDNLIGVFNVRFPIQISELHLAAYYLFSVNSKAKYEGLEQPQILGFLKNHVSLSDRLTLQREYLYYKSYSDEFAHSELWEKEIIDFSRDFWDLAAVYASTLAFIARRLLRTTSNSVPCERAFSTMKLNHTCDRNRLSGTMIDKLCFIYINKKVLDKEGRDARITHIADLKEAEEVELENIMASYRDYLPQNTEIKGEKSYTTQESTQSISSISNGNKKRPRDDMVDMVDEASRDRSNARLNA